MHGETLKYNIDLIEQLFGTRRENYYILLHYTTVLIEWYLPGSVTRIRFLKTYESLLFQCVLLDRSIYEHICANIYSLNVILKEFVYTIYRQTST